ncbi:MULTISPECIES: adenosylhomocysteinase [Microbacterium]|uniref:Adenosylhomocysteinase n=1 Tax=Microbacterium wangchenii TaxID=2541726 RepID=A0ABX5SNW6_9MICO|nr:MULTISPECIES: adenosylhomocysteinase [Microbacterium]MCK6066549.1 adenosylhomocysteinase [Microbacterium sp. EYE_512]QBR87497.1 adenosylhomocysteinase [Microbacterium wangchenii]TXK14826.1 adenosylhomocysteinase [Microbacterium wangchenii]
MTPQPRLAPSGNPDIDWAERNMPLLRQSVATRAHNFRGVHVGICLHTEPKTAVLVRWLLHYGARVTITGNLGTTVSSVAQTLSELGATVIGHRSDDHEKHQRNVDQVLAAEPDLVMDNGGELITRLACGAPRSDTFVGATEETTTGGLRIRELDVQPDFPVIVINDSSLKLTVENEYGVGQSVVQGFMNATNSMVPGARATVVGYGPCGKGTADTLRALGAIVSVVERNPFRALEAIMRGHMVGTLDDLLPQAELLFLATGARDVIAEDQFARLRDGAIIIGVGHEGAELDIETLRRATRGESALGSSAADQAPRVVYTFPDGREVVVLHGMNMINLTAAGGNPIQAMDLGLALQACSLAAIVGGAATWVGAGPVPSDIDDELATTLVDMLSRKNVDAPRAAESVR